MTDDIVTSERRCEYFFWDLDVNEIASFSTINEGIKSCIAQSTDSLLREVLAITSLFGSQRKTMIRTRKQTSSIVRKGVLWLESKKPIGQRPYSLVADFQEYLSTVVERYKHLPCIEAVKGKGDKLARDMNIAIDNLVGDYRVKLDRFQASNTPVLSLTGVELAEELLRYRLRDYRLGNIVMLLNCNTVNALYPWFYESIEEAIALLMLGLENANENLASFRISRNYLECSLDEAFRTVFFCRESNMQPLIAWRDLHVSL